MIKQILLASFLSAAIAAPSVVASTPQVGAQSQIVNATSGTAKMKATAAKGKKAKKKKKSKTTAKA